MDQIAPFYRWQGSSLMLKIRVQPGSKRDEFGEVMGDCLKVRVRGRAVEGQANRCLIRFLANYFDVSAGSVKLLSGQKSREKYLEIYPSRIGFPVRRVRAICFRARRGEE